MVGGGTWLVGQTWERTHGWPRAESLSPWLLVRAARGIRGGGGTAEEESRADFPLAATLP